MGLGGNTGLKCQFDGTEHGLFIVLQNEGQDLHHLPVTAGTLEEMALQLPERFGHLGEGRPVTQGAGLALDHRQIVPPVVDRPPRQVMGSFDDPRMLAQDLALGGDDDPFRVDPQADRPVGEGGRHAVAVALEVYEAGRRYSLGVLDEAIEGAAQRHQAGNLVGMHIGDGTGQTTMLDLAPLLDATLLKPGVQGIDIGEAGQRLPQPTPRILDVLLDLSLLPAGSRVAELWLEQVMAGHGREPGVDLPRLASANPIDCGLHVVEDPALRHAAQHPERLGQGIEQHLVGLEQIGPHDERPAVRQLGMRHLQLRALAGEQGPVLAPVELEGFAWREDQRHEGAAPAGLLLTLAVGLPGPHKGSNTTVGSIVAQDDKIGMHLLGCASLLA